MSTKLTVMHRIMKEPGESSFIREFVERLPTDSILDDEPH